MMSKKHWISVKRGLSEDPKHREAMGMAVWGFLHMIDRADWETGLVYDWRDKDEAEDMCLNERTLRDWRQRLTKEGYIACHQKPRGLEITIFNWINPREYSAGVLNPKRQGDTQGDILVSPSGIEGDTQGDTQGDTVVSEKSVTLPLDSKIKDHPSTAGAKKKGDILDGMIHYAQQNTAPKYQNRDTVPEPYLALCDAYVRITGQSLSKRIWNDWISTFQEWLDEGLTPANIEDAYKHATRPEGGFMVTRPGSLTNTAAAIKAKGLRVPELEKDRDPYGPLINYLEQKEVDA